MRVPAARAVLLLLLAQSAAALAQDQPAPAEPAIGVMIPGVAGPSVVPVLTLNQERLFRDSAYGRAVLAKAEEETSTLATENRRIEAGLEAEERDLTTRRASMKPAEFAPIAAAFDTKVEDIRAAQAAKSRDITNRLEQQRKTFFAQVVPILGELMSEKGAVAILSDQAIILSLSSLDITEDAIKRLDERLAPPADAAPASAPETTPTPAPDAPAAP